MAHDMKSYPVLIVDDDEDLCLILETAMSRRCAIHCEHTLAGAGAYLSTETPKIIFLDNNLPDGLGVLNIPMLLQQCPSVKIVLMTANEGDGLRERALRLGAVQFIAKPFKASELSQVISRLESTGPGLR